MSDISLTSSMRNNLLSLQQTTRLQQLTQNRLASGLKVNSAIDNPSSYYTAQSLNNRAEDLNVLLDAMSQGIQTLKAVNEAIESGTKFLEQAKSVASAAMENTQPIAARVKTEAELLAAINSGKQGLIVLERDLTMSTNQNIVLKDGQSLVGARYLDKSAAKVSLTFKNDIADLSSISVGSNSIVSDLTLTSSPSVANTNARTGVIYLRENSQNSILRNLDISYNQDPAASLYYSGIAAHGNSVYFELQGKINIKDTGIICDTASAVGNDYSRGICAGGIVDGSATVLMKDNAILNISTNGKYGHTIAYVNLTVKDNAQINTETHGYNSQSIAFSKITMEDNAKLNFNATLTGFLVEKSIINIKSSNAIINAHTASTIGIWGTDSSISAVKGATIITNSGYYQNQSDINPPVSFFLGFEPPTSFTKIAGATIPALPNINEEMRKDAPDDKKAKENASQFNQILAQYDKLINDASYKGVNLLKSQDLKVVFNESRSSDLDIKGINGTAAGLGLTTANWSNTQNVQDSLDELDSAINQLRLHSSEFGNYYQIVTTRENFTNSLINVLTEGADALTLADMNQESANMLALQTRQQLAINSLSLASQASQSVLKLF